MQWYKAAIQCSPRFGSKQMICSVLIPCMHRWQFKSQITVLPPCRFTDAQKKALLYPTVFSKCHSKRQFCQFCLSSVCDLSVLKRSQGRPPLPFPFPWNHGSCLKFLKSCGSKGGSSWNSLLLVLFYGGLSCSCCFNRLHYCNVPMKYPQLFTF